jgi:hypothetical protein
MPPYGSCFRWLSAGTVPSMHVYVYVCIQVFDNMRGARTLETPQVACLLYAWMD